MICVLKCRICKGGQLVRICVSVYAIDKMLLCIREPVDSLGDGVSRPIIIFAGIGLRPPGGCYCLCFGGMLIRVTGGVVVWRVYGGCLIFSG